MSVTSAFASIPSNLLWSAASKGTDATPLMVKASVSSVPSTSTSALKSTFPEAAMVVKLPAAGVAPPITASSIAPPSISGALMSGLVRVLFVSVCEPVSVATVASIATVTLFPEAVESTPVPPKIPRDSESKSMLIVVEPSVTSRSCAVTCESTYALIDCCVASFVALFEDMSSSSLIPVTVAPSPPIERLAMLLMPSSTLVPSQNTTMFLPTGTAMPVPLAVLTVITCAVPFSTM